MSSKLIVSLRSFSFAGAGNLALTFLTVFLLSAVVAFGMTLYLIAVLAGVASCPASAATLGVCPSPGTSSFRH